MIGNNNALAGAISAATQTDGDLAVSFSGNAGKENPKTANEAVGRELLLEQNAGHPWMPRWYKGLRVIAVTAAGEMQCVRTDPHGVGRTENHKFRPLTGESCWVHQA